MAKNFIDAFGESMDFEHIAAGILHGVHAPNTKRAVLFTHPLWRLEPMHFVKEQEEAKSQLCSEHNIKLKFFDLACLRKYPNKIYTWLAANYNT